MIADHRIEELGGAVAAGCWQLQGLTSMNEKSDYL